MQILTKKQISDLINKFNSFSELNDYMLDLLKDNFVISQDRKGFFLVHPNEYKQYKNNFDKCVVAYFLREILGSSRKIWYDSLYFESTLWAAFRNTENLFIFKKDEQGINELIKFIDSNKMFTVNLGNYNCTNKDRNVYLLLYYIFNKLKKSNVIVALDRKRRKEKIKITKEEIQNLDINSLLLMMELDE